LLVNTPNLGFAEGTLILGGHLGAYGKRTLALRTKEINLAISKFY
jgi:hypothetical protein